MPKKRILFVDNRPEFMHQPVLRLTCLELSRSSACLVPCPFDSLLPVTGHLMLSLLRQLLIARQKTVAVCSESQRLWLRHW